MTRLLLAALLGSLLATGCDKKDDKTTASPDKPGTSQIVATASPPSTPATPTTPNATAQSATASTFVIDSAGKVSIDMPAPSEHIKATAQKSSGELKIDVKNLAATRGDVKVDLTTLKTATFNDASKDTKQTEHALNWLEVGTLVSAEEKEKNRFIVYTIQSIEGLSASDLTKVAATKDGADEVRTVTVKANGEVSLHGKKTTRQAELSVSFRGPAEKPTRVDIKTTKPLKVVLADHDVKPRDNLGKIAQASFNLLGTKVANEADISLELTAKPK